MLHQTALFPPVSWFRQLAQCQAEAYIDTRENFRKQTIRNRYTIATATGPQTLSVPVEGSKHANICEIRISDHNNWRRLHWQALATAYGSSPFFEYYADDIEPFFHKRTPQENAESRYNWDFLLQYNMEIIETLCDLIGIKAPQLLPHDDALAVPLVTAGGQSAPGEIRIDGQSEPELKPYYQVFQSRQGFLPDMSILDLLFNMGPESILVLKD